MKIGILILSFQTLEFWSYSFKCWDSDLILWNGRILISFFQELELWSYSYKHWNSDLIFSNVGILILFFQALELWPYSYECGILLLPSETLEFSGLIFKSIGIRILSSQTLEFWPCFCKHWNFDLNLSNIGILALSLPCPCCLRRGPRVSAADDRLSFGGYYGAYRPLGFRGFCPKSVIAVLAAISPSSVVSLTSLSVFVTVMFLWGMVASPMPNPQTGTRGPSWSGLYPSHSSIWSRRKTVYRSILCWIHFPCNCWRQDH